MGGGGINKSMLLGSAQVRTELKVTDEQGKKLDEVLASYRESSRGLFGRGPREGTDEDRQKAREEAAKKRADLLKTTDEKLAGILDKTQTKRLDEIVLQQQGAEALTTEPVVAALSLKSEQVEKIKAAFAKRDEEMASLRPAGGRRGGDGGGAPGGNFQEIREKMDKLRKDTDTAAFAVLTKEQSEAFAKLKGASFELDRQTLFQGGGFGGGRGGRGEGGGGRGGDGGKKARPPDDEI
jgi:hypothetical protein